MSIPEAPPVPEINKKDDNQKINEDSLHNALVKTFNYQLILYNF